MRKIKTRKFAEMLARCDVVSSRSIFRRIEVSEMLQALINSYHRSPSAVIRTLMNTFKSPNLYARISAILRRAAPAKIIFSVIQSISVAVIAIFPRLTVGDEPMHCHRSSACHSVVGVTSTVALLRLPRPIHQPIKILSIDYCRQTLCKWNESVRLIKWLGYFVSGTECWHESSLKGFVLPGHFTLAAVNRE